MSRNVIEMDAPIDAVFEALLDPEAYPHWVVGAKRLRGVDDNWPAPGSSFHHAVGAGPAEVRDVTTVREIDPPRRLVLDAKFRPPGAARVELDLEPIAPDRTRVTMIEDSLRGFGFLNSRVAQIVADPLLTARNWWSLRRLKRIVEDRVRAR